MTAEVAVVAEQPEPVHHLPGDDDAGRRLNRGFRRRLDGRRRIRFRGLGADDAVRAGKQGDDRHQGNGKEYLGWSFLLRRR